MAVSTTAEVEDDRSGLAEKNSERGRQAQTFKVGDGKRRRSRSRSPIDRTRSLVEGHIPHDQDLVAANQDVCPDVQATRSEIDRTNLSNVKNADPACDKEQDLQDAIVDLPSNESHVNASQGIALPSFDEDVDAAVPSTSLPELPFGVSDDDAGSASDVSIGGLSMSDVPILERYGPLITDAPLTQFPPNRPCPTQDRISFDTEPDIQLSDEPFTIHRANGNIYTHEEDDD